MSQILGIISDEDFTKQVNEHIRNENIKHNTCREYDPEIFQNYHGKLIPYGHIIKAAYLGIWDTLPSLNIRSLQNCE